MPHPEKAVVTGAFSYTGGYIARNLLQKGVEVTTLTRHPDTLNSFGGAVKSAPLDFSDTDALTDSMIGASVFYNTYWIRFERGQTTFDGAVENSKTSSMRPMNAGSNARHISSQTHRRIQTSLLSRQMQVEEELKKTGVSYAIIRPTLIFGANDLYSTHRLGPSGDSCLPDVSATATTRSTRSPKTSQNKP